MQASTNQVALEFVCFVLKKEPVGAEIRVSWLSCILFKQATKMR